MFKTKRVAGIMDHINQIQPARPCNTTIPTRWEYQGCRWPWCSPAASRRPAPWLHPCRRQSGLQEQRQRVPQVHKGPRRTWAKFLAGGLQVSTWDFSPSRLARSGWIRHAPCEKDQFISILDFFQFLKIQLGRGIPGKVGRSMEGRARGVSPGYSNPTSIVEPPHQDHFLQQREKLVMLR